jgi:hypothetical protein
MEAEILVTKTVNIKKLHVNVIPRFIEDAYINGERELEDNPKMPFLTSDFLGDYQWDINIDIDKGLIENWPTDVKASIHYKVCDEGFYEIFDEKGEKLGDFNGYVPHIMCPKKPGYGDYIIMDIDENGIIQDWDAKNNIDDLLCNCGLKDTDNDDY